MNTATYSFQQLNEAVESCTSHSLRLNKDDDGKTIYILLDAHGNACGKPFYDLFEVEDFVCNSDEVHDYLLQIKK